MPLLSVIICTHNPRPAYLRRVLAGLQAQTLPPGQWELLFIDNASAEPLAGQWDLRWHPHSRHIREEELGLTPARLRGIREAAGELLVFVDDDNVLSANYLEQAMALREKHAFLGAYSGTCEAELEAPLEPWQKNLVCNLCVRTVERPQWSNFFHHPSMPFGAGLVVGRPVARRYVQDLHASPFRRTLDRIGSGLAGCGDVDLAATSFDLGLAVGLFPELVLTHLIPPARLQPEYLLKLRREGDLSSYLWEYYRLGKEPPPLLRMWTSPGGILLWFKWSPFERRLMAANNAARKMAAAAIKKFVCQRVCLAAEKPFDLDPPSVLRLGKPAPQ